MSVVQAMGPSARQIADQGMQAALEAFKRTHKTQPSESCALGQHVTAGFW